MKIWLLAFALALPLIHAETMNTKTAVVGGGCFWCTEAIFKSLRGVVSVTPGYAGGAAAAPSYEEVSGGGTGHAEVTRIEFDPASVSYRDLLTVFFGTHDPTTLNRQGHDVGTQYRSVVLYASPEQKAEGERYVAELEASGVKPVTTEIRPLDAFYPAEEYHRDYFAKHGDEPYCRVVIAPKLEHLREKFAALLKEKSKE